MSSEHPFGIERGEGAEARLPRPCPEAFHEEGEEAGLAQAAYFLALGALLHPVWREGLHASAEDAAHFPLPQLPPIQRKLNEFEVRAFAQTKLGLPGLVLPGDEKAWREAAAKVAEVLLEAPSAELAGYAILLGTLARDRLVRTAAAISHADHFDGPWRLTYFADHPLAAQLADTWILRQALSDEPAPPRTQLQPIPARSPARAASCLLLHGALPTGRGARRGPPNPWWRPGMELHRHLQAGCRPDLFGHAEDLFEWEGGHSVHAHEIAARNLRKWQEFYGLEGMDVIAHGDGGNMAILATHHGVKIRKLVLLSCPVHWPWRAPHLANLSAAQSIRIKFDLVILADRGAQRFPEGTIAEHVLPIWFKGHDLTRRAATWRACGLDRFAL